MPGEGTTRIMRALPNPWRRQSTALFSSALAMALASLAIFATAVLPLAMAAVPPSQDSAPSPRSPAEGSEGASPHRHPKGVDSTSLDQVAIGHDPGNRQATPGRSGQGLTEWNREVSGARSGSTHSIRLWAMSDGLSAEPETAAKVRGQYPLHLPHTCGGVTFSKNGTNYLVRSDEGAVNVDCGHSLSFDYSEIAGLGERVFANMPTLVHV